MIFTLYHQTALLWVVAGVSEATDMLVDEGEAGSERSDDELDPPPAPVPASDVGLDSLHPWGDMLQVVAEVAQAFNAKTTPPPLLRAVGCLVSKFLPVASAMPSVVPSIVSGACITGLHHPGSRYDCAEAMLSLCASRITAGALLAADRSLQTLFGLLFGGTASLGHGEGALISALRPDPLIHGRVVEAFVRLVKRLSMVHRTDMAQRTLNHLVAPVRAGSQQVAAARHALQMASTGASPSSPASSVSSLRHAASRKFHALAETLEFDLKALAAAAAAVPPTAAGYAMLAGIADSVLQPVLASPGGKAPSVLTGVGAVFCSAARVLGGGWRKRRLQVEASADHAARTALAQRLFTECAQRCAAQPATTWLQVLEEFVDASSASLLPTAQIIAIIGQVVRPCVPQPGPDDSAHPEDSVPFAWVCLVEALRRRVATGETPHSAAGGAPAGAPTQAPDGMVAAVGDAINLAVGLCLPMRVTGFMPKSRFLTTFVVDAYCFVVAAISAAGGSLASPSAAALQASSDAVFKQGLRLFVLPAPRATAAAPAMATSAGGRQFFKRRNTLTTDVSRMLAQLLGGARTLVASDARCRSEVVSRMAAASLTAALSSVVGPVLAPVLGRGADGPARTREALQKVHTVFLSAAATASQRKRTSQVEACLAEIGRLGFACKPGNGSNIPVAVLNSSWFFNGQPPFGRRKRRILLTPVTAL